VDACICALFRHFQKLSGQFALIIAAPKMLKVLSTSCRLQSDYYQHPLTNDLTIETLSKCLFVTTLFTKQYEGRNRSYMRLVMTLLGNGSAALKEFKDQKWLQTVVTAILKIMNNNDYFGVIDDFELLIRLTIEYDKAFSQKPKQMKYIFDF
jgi:hypothetical protein